MTGVRNGVVVMPASGSEPEDRRGSVSGKDVSRYNRFVGGFLVWAKDFDHLTSDRVRGRR